MDLEGSIYADFATNVHATIEILAFQAVHPGCIICYLPYMTWYIDANSHGHQQGMVIEMMKLCKCDYSHLNMSM